MDPAAGSPMPPPNRFAPYTDENHSATLWIASLLGLIYVVGVLVVRLFIKRRVFGFDDAFIIGSTAVSVGQFIAIFKGLGYGVGVIAANALDLTSAGKVIFSSRVLLLVSNYLAKLSGIFLLRRLFVRDDKTNGLLCDISFGFIVICGIISVFVGTVGCPSSTFFKQHCSSQVLRWSIVTALDVITEVTTLLIPPYLVWQLQMRTSYKLRVVAAFCFRVAIIIFSTMHLNAWIKYTNGEPSPFLIVPVLIWQQTLLATSLITATIPNLKAFLQSLSTNWGIDWGYSTQPYGQGTYEMGNVKRSGVTASRAESEIPYSPRSQVSGAKFKTEISTKARERPASVEHNSSHSIGSGGSQDLIIRKETQWAVESERAESTIML
ncbi:hypothetical protein BCR34DRAFT_589210 [Clohesyomyces aquaticus]|uniref:Rhodopsin domain-containing protein n=1 Tax=Clohesyomyces aquaticus TaxID=1231657 RepID=A0A1Y1ZHW3_9PLEO|nr:hypothetical protein BCR34DRAFT_589210 [Clohesyomyces aquaticus]